MNLAAPAPALTRPVLTLAAVQHLLAIFGGIVAAPLIIAAGMGLDGETSNSIISAALLTSGLATFIQVNRVGGIGSGLLSIQGTSFTFIGALVFAFHALPEGMPTAQRLGLVFGSTAVASVCMACLASQVPRIGWLLTPAVTAGTVVLLGATLTHTTLGNLHSTIMVLEPGAQRWEATLLAGIVLCVTAALALLGPPWARLSCILVGLSVGTALAGLRGWIDLSPMSGLALISAPRPLAYGMGVDAGVLLTLLPVFIVTAMESVGDLTATQMLSGLPTRGDAYWRRIRGGLTADALNSLMAALLTTFPNTTFSQNNGVIRLTGVSSPRVGSRVAVMLVLLGLFPGVAAVFQLMPLFILHAVTLIMFALIAVTGWNLLRRSKLGRRGWCVALGALLGGPLISLLAADVDTLPDQVRMVLCYPVSAGAFLALLLEILLPGRRGDQGR